MTPTFWAWFFGLYAAFASGLFLVVAIGSHQIIEQKLAQIRFLRSEVDALRLPDDDVYQSETPVHDELAVARLRRGLDEWGQR